MEVQETLEEIFEALIQMHERKVLYEFLRDHEVTSFFSQFQSEYIEEQLYNINHDIYFYKELLSKKLK